MDPRGNFQAIEDEQTLGLPTTKFTFYIKALPLNDLELKLRFAFSFSTF